MAAAGAAAVGGGGTETDAQRVQRNWRAAMRLSAEVLGTARLVFNCEAGAVFICGHGTHGIVLQARLLFPMHEVDDLDVAVKFPWNVDAMSVPGSAVTRNVRERLCRVDDCPYLARVLLPLEVGARKYPVIEDDQVAVICSELARIGREKLAVLHAAIARRAKEQPAWDTDAKRAASVHEIAAATARYMGEWNAARVRAYVVMEFVNNFQVVYAGRVATRDVPRYPPSDVAFNLTEEYAGNSTVAGTERPPAASLISYDDGIRIGLQLWVFYAALNFRARLVHRAFAAHKVLARKYGAPMLLRVSDGKGRLDDVCTVTWAPVMVDMEQVVPRTPKTANNNDADVPHVYTVAVLHRCVPVQPVYDSIAPALMFMPNVACNPYVRARAWWCGYTAFRMYTAEGIAGGAAEARRTEPVAIYPDGDLITVFDCVDTSPADGAAPAGSDAEPAIRWPSTLALKLDVVRTAGAVAYFDSVRSANLAKLAAAIIDEARTLWIVYGIACRAPYVLPGEDEPRVPNATLKARIRGHAGRGAGAAHLPDYLDGVVEPYVLLLMERARNEELVVRKSIQFIAAMTTGVTREISDAVMRAGADVDDDDAVVATAISSRIVLARLAAAYIMTCTALQDVLSEGFTLTAFTPTHYEAEITCAMATFLRFRSKMPPVVASGAAGGAPARMPAVVPFTETDFAPYRDAVRPRGGGAGDVVAPAARLIPVEYVDAAERSSAPAAPVVPPPLVTRGSGVKRPHTEVGARSGAGAPVVCKCTVCSERTNSECGRCGTAYCSEKCQSADWEIHVTYCTPA